jgi:ribosomal protein S18 acetylase RimI-like enzyme
MEIRPFCGTDEAGLLALWNASMIHDHIDETIFRTKVLLDPNFQPENLPIAMVEGRVVGFVLAFTRLVPLFLQGLEPANAWITAFGVHPDYRGRGIGQGLFQLVLAKLKNEGRKTVDIAPYTPNYFIPGVDIHAYPDAVDFLGNAAGFKRLYKAISMGANLTAFQMPPEIEALAAQREREDGITIQPVTAADLPDLMPFIVQHFGWDWYRHAQEYLLEYFGDSPSQICFLVARKHGEVVGYCQQRRERFGPFGVRPDLRNLGIGRLLLFRCLSIMSAKQVYYAYFLWTGEKAAKLYALAGFQRRREFLLFRKEL